MIKTPKYINRIRETLNGAGYETYFAGPCVRESLTGCAPEEWQIVTGGSLSNMKGIFDSGEKLHCDGGDVLLLTVAGDEEQGRQIVVEIICTGEGKKVSRQALEDFLKGMNFTVDAVADNLSEGTFDPFGGLKDISRKLIKTTGNPDEIMKNSPEALLEIVCLACATGFDISMDVYDAMVRNAAGMTKVEKDYIRDSFVYIVNSRFAGKGLRMLAGADLMPYIIGEECACRMGARERENFSVLADGIDRLQQNAVRRLGLFYLCFEGKKREAAIELLNYNGKTKEHLQDAGRHLNTLFFMREKTELKKFIANFGMERYMYLHNLSKAQRIIYDQSEVKIMNRHYMMEEIKANKEPIFPEDLEISAEDIIEEGITDDPERAAVLLEAVTDIAIMKPQINNRKDLLKNIRKINKSKIRFKTRKIKWLR